MKFVYLGVRIAAAESLPYLLECAKIRGQEYIVTMWQFVCPELLKAIDNEPENDIKSEHMHALAQVGSISVLNTRYFVRKRNLYSCTCL